MNTKKVTKAGGINIPIGMRREMNIKQGDALDVEVTSSGRIVLRPHLPRCIFCSSTEDVKIFVGKGVCSSCAGRLGKEREDEE